VNQTDLVFRTQSASGFHASDNIYKCEQGFMSDTAFKAFKYYLRGPDNWTELSGRMQHLLERFDADASTWAP
jgi:hypothetical protein